MKEYNKQNITPVAGAVKEFAVGDFVIPKKYIGSSPMFVPEMTKHIGVGGNITSIYEPGPYYRVHSFWWPASGLDKAAVGVEPAPHKWAAEMAAFSAGAIIEWRSHIGEGGWSTWKVTKAPKWSTDPDIEYRVCPDVVLKAKIIFNKGHFGNILETFTGSPESNCKLVFDHETKKLKSVEII